MVLAAPSSSTELSIDRSRHRQSRCTKLQEMPPRAEDHHHSCAIAIITSAMAPALVRRSSSAAPPIGMRALTLLLLLLLGADPALSLVINTTTKGCSRDCESRHCKDPFKLRYGKYCGVGYTGCAGEAACDGIDSCCLAHDNCVGSDLANYVNRTCNDRLKNCVERFQDSNMTQFVGSSCSAKDLEEVIITSMNIATLGESTGSPSSPLTNLQWVTALVINLPVALLFENW